MMLGLSIYFLYNMMIFVSIQHDMILKNLYNGIQKKIMTYEISLKIFDDN